MRKPKIAFAVHMLTPYRVSFYRKLFSNKEYEWKLFAGFKSKENDARPQYEGEVDFQISYYKETIWRLGPYNVMNNLGMVESVQEYDPDIIIMFAHVGTKSFRDILHWAKASKRKVVMWTCFWEPEYITGYKRIIRNYFIKLFYKKADYHLAYSSVARKKLVDIGFPDDKIAIAYNGIDVEQYTGELPTNMNQEGIFQQERVNFLYVGGFGKDKKVDLLINAINRCVQLNNSNFNAYLIGDGPMYHECRILVSKLGIANNVRFLGRITKQLSSYLKAADCIVLPGTGGLVLNEAILFQKPIIVGDADGTEVDLLINGFNGLKFMPGDVISLANALLEIAGNLPFFHENATKVTDLVKKRSNVDSMVGTFLKVIRKINYEDINSRWSPAEFHENSTYNKGFK